MCFQVLFSFIKLFVEVFVLSFTFIARSKNPLHQEAFACVLGLLMFLCLQRFSASSHSDSWGWDKLPVNVHAKPPFLLLLKAALALPSCLLWFFSFLSLPDLLHVSRCWREEDPHLNNDVVPWDKCQALGKGILKKTPPPLRKSWNCLKMGLYTSI